MKESDIRRTIAGTSERLDRIVVHQGRRAGPFVAATLVLGVGLVAACGSPVAEYDAPCPDDGCGPYGGDGGTAGAGGQGGSEGGAGHGGDAPSGGGSGGT